MLLKISLDEKYAREWRFEVNDDTLYKYLVEMGITFIEICQPEILELQNQHRGRNFAIFSEEDRKKIMAVVNQDQKKKGGK